MTENRRLIQGTYTTRRYLDSDEIFRKEMNWNINLPPEREFKNGYGIITDKNDTAYSIDELIELLNEFQKENEQLKKENEQLKEEINDLNDVLASYEELESKGFNQSNCITVQKSIICDVKKENEQLKQQAINVLEELKENINDVSDFDDMIISRVLSEINIKIRELEETEDEI